MINNKIGIIGDFILDVEIDTSSIRSTPEDSNVPILTPYKTTYKYGGAANVANILKHLTDIQIKLYCSVNTEEIHKKTNLLTTNPIYTEIVRSTVIPIEKQRIYKNGELFARLDYDYGIQPIIVEKLEDTIIKDNPRIIIISDYNKGTISNYKKIFDNHEFTLVDTKGDFNKYKGAFIIKCNKKEVLQHLGIDYDVDLLRILDNYSDHLKAISKLFIVTDGNNGCHYIDFEYSKYEHFKANNLNVVDTIGAGDAFIAGLALGLSQFENIYSREVKESIKIAMNIAQLSVTKRGTDVIKRNELKY